MAKANELPKMTGWYDPSQLLDTARKTFISTTIGENADPRLVAASGVSRKVFDYSQHLIKNNGDFETTTEQREEIWIDYTSDVGDGWNPTYAVAYSLAQHELKIADGGTPLCRGEILILGGDGVYPTASSDAYEKKLINPYKMAFKSDRTNKLLSSHKVDLKEEPHIFALPGNHDWYDSLVAFQNIFCTHFYNERIFADAWRTRQEIGYFALKLPHQWWLLGIDLQLSHNVDVRQLQFFESVIKGMKAGDKVILCVPEPYWVKAIKYHGLTDVFEKKENSIDKLEKLLIGQDVEIKTYIAGDLHHYRRFESNDNNQIQKITAGGGGAFLHPTHDFDFNKNGAVGKDETRGFTLKKNYPDFKTSRNFDWQNLYLFLWKNKTFGILTAFLYAALAWLVHGKVNGNFSFGNAFRATAESLINEPAAAIIVFLMLTLLVFFTDSNSKAYKWIGGIAHGLFHLTAIFLLGWLGYFLSLKITGKQTMDTLSDNLIWYFSVISVSALGGYFIGSFIMGLYLFVSLHIFGRHDNEAFSALKIEDYKNFLRLHIDKNGNLTVYPIKIEKVPCKWKENKDKNEKVEYYSPEEELIPELIESPIVLKKIINKIKS